MIAALTGAADRPRVTLMTALPLVWGEGSVGDVLAGRTGRSETLKALYERFDVRAIDVLSSETLAGDIAMIAQPRRLTPKELVALDKWVRAGGRAMIFADPELVWPSDYPLGDNRRAPPVTLLDPLFTHWGVTLGDSDRLEYDTQIDNVRVSVRAASIWTGPKTCAGNGSYVLDCRIGKGRIVLIGDADILDPRLWKTRGSDNPAWLIERISGLEASTHGNSTRLSGAMIVGIGLAISVILAFVYLRVART
jgi:ABC-type uncharacterized transport system